MKTMTIGDFKINFSDLVKEVKAEEKNAVTSGKKKDIKGYVVPSIEEIPEKKSWVFWKAKYPWFSIPISN